MRRISFLLLGLILVFCLSGCGNQVQEYLISQDQLEEQQPLPRYRVFLAEDYLRFEKINNGEQLIPVDILKISFPRLSEILPEMEGYKYIKKEPLRKIPELNVLVRDDYIVISEDGSVPEKTFRKVSLKEEDPVGTIFLVNQDFPLSSEYSPGNLREVNSPYLQPLYGNMRLEDEAARNLEKMAEDFYTEEKRNLILVSMYRDFAYQEKIFLKRVNSNIVNLGLTEEEAYRKASEIVAIPGTSEHQSGLAVDFTSKELVQSGRTLVGDFSKTIEGKWLAENAYKYGFILRYPEGKTEITKIVFEPWHYRYVGLPHSEIIYRNNWTLEEYLEDLFLKKANLSADPKVYYLDTGLMFIDELYKTSEIRAENDNKGGWIIIK